ncbi:hypothetical protein LPJ53_001770 [Coemansia erecta]|uniref:G-protein coupled receptors family 3 profile domain-containing protein n=1 Tax=Coemansia erecta TaxID=147472 RepID=A0A9W7Y4X7_9FUNG|nr:hypothetical protein LPJ53_001770 [Coemansia erecta]
MTFPDPAFEQQRVAYALQYMGEKLDPRTKADVAVVAVLSAVYFIDFIAVLFTLLNRRYAPIRAKSPILMALLFLASVFWCIGDEMANGHLPLAGSTLTDCRGWAILVRVLFGICLMCAVFAIRSYALYYVFKLNRPTRGLGFFIPIALYAGCIIVFLVVAMALKPSNSATYVPAVDLCSLAKPLKISIYVFIWLTWVFVAIIYFLIRNIKSSFNESREMAVACFILLIVLLFNSLVQFIHPNFPFYRGYRIASTVLDHVAANSIWWSIMGAPIFNCIFNRERYLDRWTTKLRQDGLHRAYDIKPLNSSLSNMNGLSGVQNSSFMYSSSDGHGFFYNNESDGMWQGEDGLKLTFYEDGQFLMVDRDDTEKKHTATSNAKKISWTPAPDAKDELGDPYGRRIV